MSLFQKNSTHTDLFPKNALNAQVSFPKEPSAHQSLSQRSPKHTDLFSKRALHIQVLLQNNPAHTGIFSKTGLHTQTSSPQEPNTSRSVFQKNPAHAGISPKKALHAGLFCHELFARHSWNRELCAHTVEELCEHTQNKVLLEHRTHRSLGALMCLHTVLYSTRTLFCVCSHSPPSQECLVHTNLVNVWCVRFSNCVFPQFPIPRELCDVCVHTMMCVYTQWCVCTHNDVCVHTMMCVYTHFFNCVCTQFSIPREPCSVCVHTVL